MTPVDYVRALVVPLLSLPEALELEVRVDELGTLISMRVDKEDMKTVIGRGGQTVSSIRTLLRVFGGKTATRLNLKLLEEDEIA